MNNMNHPQGKKDDILELIPHDKLSPEQKSFRRSESEEAFPIYKLLREPRSWNDFDLTKDIKISIWLDNGTLVCIGTRAFAKYDERKLYFRIHGCGNDKYGSTCTIYGKSDAAIAETAVFFMSLKHPEGGLSICSHKDNNFDVAALKPEQLAQILDANPKRSLCLGIGIWTVEQSIVLATRAYPLDFTLSKYFMNQDKVAFVDEGTAFIDALEKRQSSFGSLHMRWDLGYDKIPFSSDNQRRLFKLEVFEMLQLRSLDKELVLLPFATKVNTLDYEMESRDVQPEDFDSLDIAAKNLRLQIYFSSSTNDWDAILISVYDDDNDDNDSSCCTIHGKTNAAIAETAVLFWSLKHPKGRDSCLRIESDDGNNFDFAALRPGQLARNLDANPKRGLLLRTGIWSVEQAVVLATLASPLKLTLSFTDEAT